MLFMCVCVCHELIMFNTMLYHITGYTVSDMFLYFSRKMFRPNRSTFSFFFVFCFYLVFSGCVMFSLLMFFNELPCLLIWDL
jgi:hypothetical protein